MATDEETWLANNPTHPEAVAIMAECADAERIRKAHEPKRFIIRRTAGGNWATKDQAHPHWTGSRPTLKEALTTLSAIGPWLGPWDGVVRVVPRKPEPDYDEYDESWDE